MDEALGILAKQRRAKLNQQAKARFEADAGRFEVDDKNEKASLVAWENFRDTYMLRAADLRSPAPERPLPPRVRPERPRTCRKLQ